jgi:hypothetical protein
MKRGKKDLGCLEEQEPEVINEIKYPTRPRYSLHILASLQILSLQKISFQAPYGSSQSPLFTEIVVTDISFFGYPVSSFAVMGRY